MLCHIFVISVICKLCCCAENSPLVGGERKEGQLTAEELSASVFRVVMEKADPNRNFVVAPKQIEELIKVLKEFNSTSDNEEDFGSQSNETTSQSRLNSENDRSEEFFNSQKIVEVVNKIVIYDNNNNNTDFSLNHLTDLASKLPNSRIEQRRSSGAALHSVQLFNSVALNARWAFNFQQRDTQKLFFYNSPQQRVVRDVMRKDDVFRFARLDDLNASALELRLLDSEHSLLIVLPQVIDGFAALQKQLSDVTTLQRIAEERLRPMLVRLLLPKFKIVHRMELRPLLEERTSLDSKATRIQHEAMLEVSEDGLGSLPRRTVLFWNTYSSLRTTPQLFHVNHPFFFIIRNNNNSNIQFVGHVAKL